MFRRKAYTGVTIRLEEEDEVARRSLLVSSDGFTNEQKTEVINLCLSNFEQVFGSHAKKLFQPQCRNVYLKDAKTYVDVLLSYKGHSYLFQAQQYTTSETKDRFFWHVENKWISLISHEHPQENNFNILCAEIQKIRKDL